MKILAGHLTVLYLGLAVLSELSVVTVKVWIVVALFCLGSVVLNDISVIVMKGRYLFITFLLGFSSSD
jgi:hypothetical protein